MWRMPPSLFQLSVSRTTIDSPQNTIGESVQNMTETEAIQLPNELLYEPVTRTVDRRATANHLSIYVLRQWRRSIPKVAFRPPIGYLEPLCFMPVDIFYEVLEHLHPIDLYHIGQLNRAFQTLLSHPTSSSAWTLAFENHPAIPKCPPVIEGFAMRMSALEWAGILFGKHTCRVGASVPFCRFQRKICTDMFENDHVINLIYPFSNTSVTYPRLRDNRILKLSQDSDLLKAQWYRYSQREMLDIHEAVTGYEAAIKNGEPGAGAAFNAYRAKRRAEVDLINEHTKTCRLWAEELRKCYMYDLERRRSNIMKRIRSRSRRLGHHPGDVEQAISGTSASRLLNKRWRSIKPLLEQAITLAKNERRALERAILIMRRKDFVHELYREYKKSTSPVTWAYLPPPYVVYQFNLFADLIYALHDDELDKDCCENALRRLPEDIEVWAVAKKRELVSLLPRGSNGDTAPSQPKPNAGHSAGTSGSSGTSWKQGADLDAFQLATSVFCCLCSDISQLKRGRCLIGWDAACPHLRCSALETQWEKQLRFSQRGRDAVKALVNLACLDPKTTTTDDMDRLDHRYICTLCPIVSFRGGFKGRRAYNWRDAVLHYIKKSDAKAYPAHSTPRWVLLTAKDENNVKRREVDDPYTTESSWSCALCPEHFENTVPRKEAIEHVKTKHNIHIPVETTHFFYLITNNGRTPRQQVGFVQSRLSNYTHYISRMKCALNHLRRSLRSH